MKTHLKIKIHFNIKALTRLALPTLAILAILFCSATVQGQDADQELLAVGVFNSPEVKAKPVEVSTLGFNEPSVDPSSIGSDDSRLRIKLGDVGSPSIPVRNGGLVNLGDGLQVEVFVDPFPTNTLTAWVDLYLSIDSREGGGVC